VAARAIAGKREIAPARELGIRGLGDTRWLNVSVLARADQYERARSSDEGDGRP